MLCQVDLLFMLIAPANRGWIYCSMHNLDSCHCFDEIRCIHCTKVLVIIHISPYIILMMSNIRYIGKKNDEC
jgi:hypothetical protein